MDEAKSKAIVVYLSTKKDKSSEFPQGVKDALAMPGAGKYIPKLAITDSSSETALGIIAYEKLKKDARGSIRDILKATESESDEDKSDLPERPTYSQEEWTSSDGNSINATFRSLNGESLTLILADGRSTTIPLSRLSEASQNRAKELSSPTE